jgi:hypothetical protein
VARYSELSEWVRGLKSATRAEIGMALRGFCKEICRDASILHLHLSHDV